MFQWLKHNPGAEPDWEQFFIDSDGRSQFAQVRAFFQELAARGDVAVVPVTRNYRGPVQALLRAFGLDINTNAGFYRDTSGYRDKNDFIRAVVGSLHGAGARKFLYLDDNVGPKTLPEQVRVIDCGHGQWLGQVLKRCPGSAIGLF